MRVGANLSDGGGCSPASGTVAPGRRKRGGVPGLPSSVGCKRSLPEFAVLPELAVLASGGPGVCARLGHGNNPIAAVSTRPAAFGARQRRLKGDFLAPKARTCATVRIASEVAKAIHRGEAHAGARSFPVPQPRDWSPPAAELGPDG